MRLFFDVIAGVLIAVILCLYLGKENKGITTLLSLAVCAMIIMISLSFLQPVIEFIHRLQDLANLDNTLLKIILKVVGIGLLTEFSVVICKDAGNESMAKALQILSTVLIIWTSIPVFEILISLLDDILGTI